MVVEEVAGDAWLCRVEMLFDPRIGRAALLGKQVRIAGKARVASKGLIEAGFLDALPVIDAQPRGPPEIVAVTQRVCGSGTGDAARAEIGVVFLAEAGVEHETVGGLPAQFHESRLIVAPGVEAVQIREAGVLNFVGVAQCGREMPGQVAGLALEAGAVELIAGDEREIAVGGGDGVRRTREITFSKRIGREEVCAERISEELVNIVLETEEPMLPMRAGGEIPTEARDKSLKSYCSLRVGGVKSFCPGWPESLLLLRRVRRSEFCSAKRRPKFPEKVRSRKKSLGPWPCV